MRQDFGAQPCDIRREYPRDGYEDHLCDWPGEDYDAAAPAAAPERKAVRISGSVERERETR